MGHKRKRGAKDGPNADEKRAKPDRTPTESALQKVTLRGAFVERPTGDERKREAQLYEILGSENENERIVAADAIISGLFGSDPVPEAVLQRHLERRLFRGLASGRNASRLGFSIVITEVLTQLFGSSAEPTSSYDGLTFEKVLEFLTDRTQSIGSVSGQEERDHFFGQLFGLECFVRSRILFADASRWSTALDLILGLGHKKVWLRSQCGWVIIQALGQMDQKETERTLQKVAEAGLAKTPEGVGIWLTALGHFPSLSVKPWRDPLSTKSLGDLAAVLKEGSQDAAKDHGDKTRNSKQANSTAQLHFVWDIILDYFLKDDASAGDLDSFWSRVVDDGLFSKNATDGQKFRGFMVFQKMLVGLADDPAKLECLFSKNLMTCLMNQAAKEDRYLHRAAVKALKTIGNVVSSKPAALVPILKNILSKDGAYNFDQRTNSKTVDKMLQNVGEQNLAGVLKVIRQPVDFLATEESTEAQSTLRIYVDYLSKVLNTLATAPPGEDESYVVQEIAFIPVLKELSRLAYSTPKDTTQSAMTEPIKELCRTRLESSFAKLTRRVNDFALFCRAVSSIDSSSVTMDAEIEAAITGAKSRMHQLLKRETKTDDERFLAHGLAMLHAVSILQLYNEDPDAMEGLGDLDQYSERLETGEAGDEEAGTSELFVEILLSMVARPSSLMRAVSQQVFNAFTSHISEAGLQLLTDPLASGESTKGQKELFNTEDDDMDVDDDESSGVEDVEDASDVEVDSDVEFVGLNGNHSQDDSSEGEEEGDDETSEDGDAEDAEEKDQEPQDPDEIMGNILGSHRLDKDGDAESSSSDEDMSDSEMLALDEKLAEVFKQRAKARPDSKKQKKDAKQSVVNFKHRILDLLDIYVKNEALNPITFSLLTPLLRLMRTTAAKPLDSRACEIILSFQRGVKKAKGRENAAAALALDAESLLELLVEVHGEAGQDNAHAYARAASAASLTVASAMVAAERGQVRQVAAVYAQTQSDWVLGEAKLQAAFFADWNNWCQNLASHAHA